MTAQTTDRHGVRVLVLPEQGPVIADEQGALDVIGQAFGEEAELVAIPLARLDPAFTHLASGVAGAIVQKFVNYRMRLVVVGPVEDPSVPLRDWMREANAGRELWFVADLAELDTRLSGART
ncbi:hypothetical protein Acsp06_34170 [Actinomycetospora sp. NBRC 106375]|uniref:DUF4180 domain-containing protein n=1 Tax=Actinomycetospora sp. NBRC 106375 TaxID=3032207 RepID=UPI0024A4A74E|nr:DUF4180 domain-containing protein [Actinomycetospora sp. NBRC 106375]GLZ47232.1 hypothetical protein Acsp06_34170 [Actinomycetospora sp. NBRC 106375]